MYSFEVAKRTLCEINYFHNIGKSDTGGINFQCEYIDSLEKALKHLESRKWDLIQTERLGDISANLSKYHKEASRTWNDAVATVRAEIYPFVLEKVESLQIESSHISIIKKNVRYDIIAIATSIIYQDLYRSEFHKRILDIYMAGHLPCGWCGKSDRGYLIVY